MLYQKQTNALLNAGVGFTHKDDNEHFNSRQRRQNKHNLERIAKEKVDEDKFTIGDPHGSKHEISRFCNRMRLTEQDTIVVLGDVGANYYGDDRDGELKRAFRRLKPTIFCIHGNHEMRPASLPAYKQKEWCGGQVWYEEEYPNLLFARDGDIFTIEGLKHLVIGGEKVRSISKRMVLSVPADSGLTVDGVLSVLNASGSGFDNWERSENKNGGYPYPSKITF